MVTLSYHFSPWDRDTVGFYHASSEQNATQNLRTLLIRLPAAVGFVFETGTHIAQVDLKLILRSMTLNFWSFSLHIPSAGNIACPATPD